MGSVFAQRPLQCGLGGCKSSEEPGSLCGVLGNVLTEKAFLTFSIVAGRGPGRAEDKATIVSFANGDASALLSSARASAAIGEVARISLSVDVTGKWPPKSVFV